MNTLKECQIHRFRDYVCIHLNEGQTVYMSPEDAAKIAAKLDSYAGDILTNTFTKSNFGTFALKVD